MDVASARELDVALRAGMVAERVSFAGPGRQDWELERAVAAGITVNVESSRELERLADLAAKRSHRPKVAVRVNPDFELKSSGMKMAGGPEPYRDSHRTRFE